MGSKNFNTYAFCVCGISIGLCAHCLTVTQHVTHQSFKVTLRIVSMMQKGELDASVAMHLLGKGGLAESTRGEGAPNGPQALLTPNPLKMALLMGMVKNFWMRFCSKPRRQNWNPSST